MLTTVRDLGAAVRYARDQAGLSQQALADQAGVHRQWVTRLETGASPVAEMRKVLDVLAVLGLAVELVATQRNDDNDDPFAELFARRTVALTPATLWPGLSVCAGICRTRCQPLQT